MHSILVPVDGSESALRALKHVIQLVQDGYPGHIHVLYVQPIFLPMYDFEFIDYQTMQEALDQQTKNALGSACKLLDQSRLEYTRHEDKGPVSTRIVDYAKDLACDSIVMGTRGMSAFGNWILGSTANQVVHLAQIPVTLIK